MLAERVFVRLKPPVKPACEMVVKYQNMVFEIILSYKMLLNDRFQHRIFYFRKISERMHHAYAMLPVEEGFVPVSTPDFLTRGDSNVENSDIQKILQSFRDNLPSESKTARAIDRGASLEDISACAEEEGIHQLANALFEIEQEAWRGSPDPDAAAENVAALTARLQEFRQQLPNSSKTAQAIDRGASLEELSACAEEEGLHEFAAMLFEAEQEQERK